jgi:hypothetical protein
MSNLLIIIFALSIAYAVIGNVVVYVILIRRKVPVRFLWAGTPGYLYRICANQSGLVSSGLRKFALSTNILFLVGIVLGVGLGGFGVL